MHMHENAILGGALRLPSGLKVQREIRCTVPQMLGIICHFLYVLNPRLRFQREPSSLLASHSKFNISVGSSSISGDSNYLNTIDAS